MKWVNGLIDKALVRFEGAADKLIGWRSTRLLEIALEKYAKHAEYELVAPSQIQTLNGPVMKRTGDFVRVNVAPNYAMQPRNGAAAFVKRAADRAQGGYVIVDTHKFREPLPVRSSSVPPDTLGRPKLRRVPMPKQAVIFDDGRLPPSMTGMH